MNAKLALVLLCSLSFSLPIMAADIPEGIKNPDDSSVISGKSKASEGTSTIVNAKGHPEDAKINFGPIQTMWRDVRRNDSLCILLKLSREEKKPLQFALIEGEDNLDNIKDPSQSQYEYLSGQKRMVTVPNKKDKDAYQKAYQKQLRQLKTGQRVTGNLEPFVHSEMKVFDNKVTMPLDAIIILKLDTAYVAIKPISLRLKYKSVKEVPKWAQKSWRKELEKGEVPPIHDLMTYEWKYWPKVIVPEGTTAKKAEKKKTWETSAIPIGKEFYIGGTKFLWKEISGEKNQRFLLKFVFNNRENPNEYIGYFHASWETSIFNPSKYKFQNSRHVIDTSTHYFEKSWEYFEEAWWEKEQDHVLILKIGEKYIAIKPIEERKGWIQYQWKYWPEFPPVESAKTAPSK